MNYWVERYRAMKREEQGKAAMQGKQGPVEPKPQSSPEGSGRTLTDAERDGQSIVPQEYWLAQYREVAQMTSCITERDPRFLRVVRIVDRLDEAFFAEDLRQFNTWVTALKEVVSGDGSHDTGAQV